MATTLLGPLGCGANGHPPTSHDHAASTSVAAARGKHSTDEAGGAMNDADGARSDPADETVPEVSNPPPGTLLVTLRADAARSGTDEPLELWVEARNATDGDVALLTWNTPFEPTLSADAFAIMRDGEPVPYRGRLVKRALPPPDEAVVRLAPGERFDHALDLSRHYALDVPGTYAIELAPGPVAIDDGSDDGGGFATLAPADEEPIVVERR